MSVVNNKITVKTEEEVMYGISIADLRTAFRSSRIDLLAIICEDARRGAPILGADMADGITNGTDTFYSAFALSDIYVNSQGQWERSNAIPIPQGWSFILIRPASFTSGRSYEKGDLIYGRHPKWHIWGDGFNIGKVIKYNGYTYDLYYNIFKNPWSNGETFPTNNEAPDLWPTGYTVPTGNKSSNYCPDLFAFLGYMTKISHEPIMEIIGNGFGDWHNGIQISCKDNNTLRCRWVQSDNYRSIRDISDDSKKIFWSINETTDISIKMALGNIVDWWKKTPYSSLLKNYNNTLYGMASEISFKPEFYIDTEIMPVIARATLTSLNVLGYDNSDKVLFRDGTTTNVSTSFNVYRSYIWNELIRNNYPEVGSEVKLDVLINLIGIRTLNAPDPLRDIDKVNLNLALETKYGLINNIIDPNTKYDINYPRYRFVIQNEVHTETITVGTFPNEYTRTYDVPKITINNETRYIWPLHGNNINTLEHNWTFGLLTFDCIRFQFCLMKSLKATAENLVTGEELRALWDVTFCDETTGIIIYRWKGVTDVLPVVNGNSTTKYGYASDANSTFLPADIRTSDPKSAKAYVTGISTGLSGELILNTIPSTTTAKLEIVPVDSVPAFLNTTDNYNSIADAFYYEIGESSSIYGYFILDYEPRFIDGKLTLRCQIWSISSTPTTKFNYIPSNIIIQLCDKNYNSKYEWTVAKGNTSTIHGTITCTSLLSGNLTINKVIGPAISPKPVLGLSTGHIIVNEELLEIHFSGLLNLESNKDLIFNISI